MTSSQAFWSAWLTVEKRTNCQTSGAYHRTLFHVWVAPWGEPATMGIWIGLFEQDTILSSLRPRALHVASRDWSFNSIPSSRWLIEPVNVISRFWKAGKLINLLIIYYKMSEQYAWFGHCPLQRASTLIKDMSWLLLLFSWLLLNFLFFLWGLSSSSWSWLSSMSDVNQIQRHPQNTRQPSC